MLGIHDLALFIVSGLLLNMMPGPDSLLIMLRSGSQGWRAGSMAALGIGTGTMVHVLAAALGLSALLSASAELFAVIKLMGGALSGLSRRVHALAEEWHFNVCGWGCGAACALLWAHLSAGVAHQCPQSQGGALLSRFCAPVHRSRFTAKGDGIHRAGLHLQSQRHDLVPSAGVFHRVCKPQGATARPGGHLAESRDGGAVRGARYQAGGGVSR